MVHHRQIENPCTAGASADPDQQAKRPLVRRILGIIAENRTRATPVVVKTRIPCAFRHSDTALMQFDNAHGAAGAGKKKAKPRVYRLRPLTPADSEWCSEGAWSAALQLNFEQSPGKASRFIHVWRPLQNGILPPAMLLKRGHT